MLTITYNKILANLNNMWKYARLYLIIQELKWFHIYFLIFFTGTNQSFLWKSKAWTIERI